VMSARALRLPPLRPLRAGLPALALAAAATAAAALVTPADPLARIVLRVAVLGALYLPAAAWLLRADLREALRSAGLASRAERQTA